MMKKRNLTTNEKEAVIGRVSEILQQKAFVLFAYIFGTFASDADFGDIDVGIFVADRDIKSALQTELDMEGELEDAVKIPVDVRIINHAPLSFVYNVLRGGSVIVDNNKSLRAEFEGLIYKKYFDFRYLRREYLREIVNAPV